MLCKFVLQIYLLRHIPDFAQSLVKSMQLCVDDASREQKNRENWWQGNRGS